MTLRARHLAAAAALLALALPALAAADPPKYGIVRPSDEASLSKAELGRQLYAGNCSMCHGSQGEGVNVRGPARASGAILGAGPSLRDAGERAADLYLRTGMMPLENPTSQPVRSRVLFTERELDALIAHVGSFGGPPIPEVHPERGDVAKGQSLFTEHCAGCHQVVAQGGYVTGARVPPLEDATATQIAEAVRVGPYQMPVFSEKAISDGELDDIVAYVQYTKNPAHPGGWPIGYLGPLPEGMVTWFIALVAIVATCVVIGRRLKQS